MVIVPVVIAVPATIDPANWLTARFRVVAPDPLAIARVLVPEELPRTIFPVCAVPPIVIVPDVVAAPIAYVVVAAPLRTKFPVPACNVRAAAPVVEPIVTRFAAASLAIPTVLPPPVREKLPVPVAMVIAPVEPPIVVVAVPEALRLTVPTAVKLVNVPAAGVVPPMAGGAAKTAARLDGCTASAVTPGIVAVPATA